MLKVFIAFLLPLLVTACDAPSSYDECVLKEMKGQAKEMVVHARDLCESKFPFEKELYGYKDKIDIGWWSSPESLYVRINKNFGEYRITRYKASFSPKDCANITGYMSTEAYTITKTFEFNHRSDDASVYIGSGADQYKCMRTEEIHGVRKR